MRLIALALLAALSACAPAEENSSQTPSVPIGEGFDFYVLALSWSPGYCATEADNADPRQCGEGRRYQFIAHGLWPQFERGYPANCESDYGERIDRSIAEGIVDIMPSFGLIFHQWRKHGRCSGLSPEDYFQVTRAAFEKINMPESFSGLTETKTISPAATENLFIAANPDIESDGIAATCKRNHLRDVRICMTKDLTSFRSCPEVDRNQCNSNAMAVVPAK